MRKDGFKTWYAVSFAFQLGFLIAVPIGGFMFLGIWLDETFYTFPLFLIVGILAGLGITLYEVYHFLTPLIKGNYD
jgi:F0F1-type ATP synthase assembly protein I